MLSPRLWQIREVQELELVRFPFVKFGQNGAVRYSESAVLDYIEANTFKHTGEVK